MIWNRDGITWYSEDEVEVLKKNASVFQKYITQNKQLKTEIDCLVKKNEKLKAENDKLKTCLQEIKDIAEQMLEKGLEPQSVEHQLRLKGKRELASMILDLITKAESEG